MSLIQRGVSMFSFFKRSDSVPSASANRPNGQGKSKSTSARSVDFLSPMPVPEVTEGNLDSDWAMWEDSVLEQDSHLPSQFADTQPSQLDDPSASELEPERDPFAKVSRHTP